MNLDVLYIIVFLFSIVIHELGHYIAYRIFGFKPIFKFRWWGISIGDNCFIFLNHFQSIFIIFAGVLSGYVVIYWLPLYYKIIYFFACLIDFVIAIQNYDEIFKGRGKTDIYYTIESEYKRARILYKKFILANARDVKKWKQKIAD